MINKIKQKLIAVILAAVLLVTAVLVTAHVIPAFADNGYVETPQITVLTHGLASFNGASHWSNTFPVTYKEPVMVKGEL